MLELSTLGRGGPALVPASPPDLNGAYARYLAGVQAQGPGAVPMSATEFERYSLGTSWLTGVRQVAKRVVQTCRLVIGIHDYEYYLDHMRSRHPQATPLTREAFYRYCLEARYPSAGRSGGRCPC